MHKAYRYRLYPNKEQITLINKTIGSSRFVFNHFLDKWNNYYKETKKSLGYHECATLLTRLKSELEWLKEVDSTALQQSLKHLDTSFKNFFRELKKGNSNQGLPQFKKKHGPNQSYKTVSTIKIEGDHIQLPKLGWVKFANSRQFEGKIVSATVRRNPTGKFFVSVLVDEHISELAQTGSKIGIDLGIAYFAYSSEGKSYENPQWYRSMQQKLAKEQRKLSRRYEVAKKSKRPLTDCKNYQKQRLKVNEIHESITNSRNDYLHKLSTELVKNHDIICMEDLNVKGMMKNHKLAKAISEVSWTKFKDMVAYKCAWYGKKLVSVNAQYTSQTCFECGHISKENRKTQSGFDCVKCGHTANADLNASKNILKRGLQLAV